MFVIIFYGLQGLIQSVFELRDGSGVVVTIGKYVTPNHIDINGGGIEPDFRSLPGLLKTLESCLSFEHIYSLTSF